MQQRTIEQPLELSTHSVKATQSPIRGYANEYSDLVNTDSSKNISAKIMGFKIASYEQKEGHTSALASKQSVLLSRHQYSLPYLKPIEYHRPELKFIDEGKSVLGRYRNLVKITNSMSDLSYGGTEAS